MRKQVNNRFPVEDIARWRELAQEECGGNLNEWMLRKLRGGDDVLDVLARIERKLDEVLGNYVEWET